MIGTVALVIALTGFGADSAPVMITVSGVRGESQVPVRSDATGAPVVAAPALLSALDGSARVADGWAEVSVARQAFRFLVGAPLYMFGNQLQPLAGSASVSRDTLFLPFQFVVQVLPSFLGERYRYDGRRARLIDLTVISPPTRTPAPTPVRETRLPNGLRPGHIVTIDPGHGGVDPGNPGVFFPP